MLENKITRFSIQNDKSLLDALKKMDASNCKLLIVVDSHDKYVNLISIGDIQRKILNGVSLSETIYNVEISDKVVSKEGDSQDIIKQLMFKFRLEFMPVISELNSITNILEWKELFESSVTYKNKINLPVVIMAGGKGTRLKPISNVFPKPLIPIGEKTIIEEIAERFIAQGCTKFYITVNYKKELIEYFLSKSKTFESVSVTFISEPKPLGTGGALAFLQSHIKESFIVTNCDILIEQDLSEVYNYHKNNNNNVTIVSSIKSHKISYGTLTTGVGGVMQSMNEKPELNFQINTGVYILEPSFIDNIEVNKFIHITDVINDVNNKESKVGVFPISESSWKDIGEWPEYIKTVKSLSGDYNFEGLNL